MRPLRQVIGEYRKEGQALGHFNISDSNQLEALARAAKETNLPVIVGLSEGEREFFPLTHARALIDLYIKEGISLYLNADHTYSLPKVASAIASGIDSIVVDGAQLPFTENVVLLKESVARARGQTKDILVEGELGYIGSSSSVMDKIPQGAAVTEEMMTRPEELKALVEETGIDLVAPAVGNIHGIITSGQPKLSINRIRVLAEAVNIPLVLHGGSGSSDEEFSAAVQAGITIIHINTDLRILYRDDLQHSITKHPDVVAPYKILGPVEDSMQSYIAQKMRLFVGKQ